MRVDVPAQVGALHVAVRQELLGRALQDDGPHLQHVTAMRDLQRAPPGDRRQVEIGKLAVVHHTAK